MMTWWRGTSLLAQKTRRQEVPVDTLIANLERRPPHIVPGTAIFLTSQPQFAPSALLHNLKHNKMLHEKNYIVSVFVEDIPCVDDASRVEVLPGSDRFSYVRLKFGYMESPNVPKALGLARKDGNQVRHHVDIVFSFAEGVEAGGFFENAALARSTFYCSHAVLKRCYRLFSDSYRTSCRSGHTDFRLSTLSRAGPPRWPPRRSFSSSSSRQMRALLDRRQPPSRPSVHAA